MHHGRKKSRNLEIQKQSEDKIIKSIRNLFRLTKENEVIKDRTIRDVKTLFELEDLYKPVRVVNFYGNNYIEYVVNGDENKTLLIKEYQDKIKPYWGYNKPLQLSKNDNFSIKTTSD